MVGKGEEDSRRGGRERRGLCAYASPATFYHPLLLAITRLPLLLRCGDCFQVFRIFLHRHVMLYSGPLSSLLLSRIFVIPALFAFFLFFCFFRGLHIPFHFYWISTSPHIFLSFGYSIRFLSCYIPTFLPLVLSLLLSFHLPLLITSFLHFIFIPLNSITCFLVSVVFIIVI